MERRRFLETCGRGTLLFALVGCSGIVPTQPDEDSVVDHPFTQANVGPEWENNILSEACYSLCRSRDGFSHLAYSGKAMSDWDYPHSDSGALSRCTALSHPFIGPLGIWNGRYRQGGWCKFFVNMLLYRSSYGYPSGHLYLKTGYSWNPSHHHSEAQVGWILQSATAPHTAVVVKRMANGGLDVIDSNWIGTVCSNGSCRYSYVIGRHEFSENDLNRYNFRAYRAHEVCQIVA